MDLTAALYRCRAPECGSVPTSVLHDALSPKVGTHYRLGYEAHLLTAVDVKACRAASSSESEVCLRLRYSVLPSGGGQVTGILMQEPKSIS